MNDYKRANILIVNDKLYVRDLLCDVLTDEGYNVETAEDGHVAVERVRERPFDIIFMDVMMPRINGLETYKAIKEVGSGATVIMMTGAPGRTKGLIEEALKLGAHRCLKKPFLIIEVMDIVKRILGAR